LGKDPTALSGPTASKTPFTTKYGSFMSAYAPIDDSSAGSSGDTSAVLAIDISAKDFVAAGFTGKDISATGLFAIILGIGGIVNFGWKRETSDEPVQK
jgi:hypothetical protein